MLCTHGKTRKAKGTHGAFAAPKHPWKEPCGPAAARAGGGIEPQVTGAPSSPALAHTVPGSAQGMLRVGETRGHSLPLHRGRNTEDGCKKVTQGFANPKSSSTPGLRCNSSLRGRA